MTILTKPTEKKSEKVPLPLSVENNGSNFPSTMHNNAPLNPADSDYETESMVFRPRRVSASKTIFLCLSAISVMLMGILGGVTIYRLYAPSAHRMHYRGFCEVPYLPSNNSMARVYRPPAFPMAQLQRLFPDIFGNGSENETFNMMYNNDMDHDEFFREDIELDDSSDESYSKIEVPEFKDSRRGLFMHDFKENQSAIIDTRAHRCFIMPLDRETTLLPRNFHDLLQKMYNGYYDINTERVRKNMRVVTPELTDLSLISPRIANECRGKKVYMLEKYVSGVFKRSVSSLPETGKFAEFSGKNIVEFNLMNIHDIEFHEGKIPKI